MTYVEKINNYYTTDHFKQNFGGKWVVRMDQRANFEVPFFAMQSFTNNNGWFFPNTCYVSKAKIFSSNEEANKYITEKNLFDFHAFQF